MTGSVSRAELTPLGFLRRSASCSPTASRSSTASGGRPTPSSRGGCARWRPPYGSAASSPATAWRCSRRTRRRCSRRTSPSRPPGRARARSTRACGAARSRRSSSDAGARVVLADPRCASCWRTLDADVVRVDDTGADGDPYEELVAARHAGRRSPRGRTTRTRRSRINYTSGTTGKPKGVMYTHRGAYLNALGEVVETGLDATRVYLWTLPMFHCNGWCYPWAVTAVGAARHVCLRRRRRRPRSGTRSTPTASRTLRRADRATIGARRPPRRAHRSTQPVRVAIGGAPPTPDAASRRWRRSASASSTSTG